MIRLRPYLPGDEASVLSWCTDEETFFRWTAGTLGAYPLTSAGFAGTAGLMRFTALDGEEPVGFFTLRNLHGSPEEVRIGYVLVSPEKRGRGIGRGMLSLALKFAFEIYGARRATLGVLEGNLPAFACYRAIGFRETGARETYDTGDRPMAAVEMEMKMEKECRKPEM